MTRTPRALLGLPLGLACVLVACGSTAEPVAIELTGTLGSAMTPFTVSGQAVDDGLVCAAVTMEQSDFEDLDGNPLSRDEVAVIAESSADFVWTETYTCDDGSGSFLALAEQLTPASQMEPNGANDSVSIATIERGTGDYASLTGSWTADVDFSSGIITMVGEVSVD